MNTPLPEKENLLKKPWHGFQGALLWFFLLFCAAFLIVFCFNFSFGTRHVLGDVAGVSFAITAVVTIVAVIVFFIFRLLTNRVYRRRFLVVCACGVTLIALLYAEEDWRGKHDLQNFESQWEAKGEKFDYASVVPAAVPDDQNFALTPIMFTTYGSILTRDGQFIPYNKRDTNFVDRLKMPLVRDNDEEPTNGAGTWQKATLTDLKPWQSYYRELAAKTNMFPVPPAPQTPAQDVLLALSKYDSTIEELRQAAQLPYSRFPLNYNTQPPFGILLPHLAQLKVATRTLELRTIAELQNGQSDKALADIKLSLRLVDSIHTEPFIISHLVRIAMVAITLQPIYEGLAEHQWSDAQLIEINSELAKLDFLADFEFSMRGERACGIQGLEYIRRTRDLNVLQSGNGPRQPINLNFLIPSAFFYQNELTIARMDQQWALPDVDITNRIVSPDTVRQNETAATEALSHWSPYNFFARMILADIAKAVKKYAREQSSVDLARVAIALDRYRLAHGAYPDSLDALAPQFMDIVPHDIINGDPLKYHRTADNSFILYSVGWNGTDDGGVTAQTKGGVPDWDRGDLVWKYPQ